MTFADWYIEQFRDTLGEPLHAADGLSDSEIDEALGGRCIPVAMRDYYRVAGKHWLNTNHNELRAPSALESIGDYTIFMDENQVVVQWALRTSEMALDDPVVYQGQRTDSTYDWSSQTQTFSRFMMAMWRWILTGEAPE